jgi:hypothetical protein
MPIKPKKSVILGCIEIERFIAAPLLACFWLLFAQLCMFTTACVDAFHFLTVHGLE